MSLRRRWSSRTSSRTWSGSRSRCHERSASTAPGPSGAGAADSLDGIGGGAEVVLGDVSDAGRLAGGEGGEACRPGEGPSRAHGVPAHRSSLHHRQLSSRPGPGGSDGFTGAVVTGPVLLEVLEDVLGAIGCPQREALVVLVRE